MKTTSVFSALYIIFFIVLSVFQLQTASLKNVYSQTPAQIDGQITRMRYYPPKLTRLGYWLEGKKETQIIYILQKNFIETIDLTTYFPDYFSFVFLPFMLLGLYRIIRKNYRLIIGVSLLSIMLTTLTGVNGLHGPLLMMAMILIFIIFGAKELFLVIGSSVSRVRPCKSRV